MPWSRSTALAFFSPQPRRKSNRLLRAPFHEVMLLAPTPPHEEHEVVASSSVACLPRLARIGVVRGGS